MHVRHERWLASPVCRTSPSKDCRSRAPNRSSSGNKVNLDTGKQQGKKKFEETMRATFRIFSFAFGEPCYALNLLSDRCLRTCGFPAHFSAVYARQFFTRPARIPLSFNLVRDRDCTEVDAFAPDARSRMAGKSASGAPVDKKIARRRRRSVQPSRFRCAPNRRATEIVRLM